MKTEELIPLAILGIGAWWFWSNVMDAPAVAAAPGSAIPPPPGEAAIPDLGPPSRAPSTGAASAPPPPDRRPPLTSPRMRTGTAPAPPPPPPGGAAAEVMAQVQAAASQAGYVLLNADQWNWFYEQVTGNAGPDPEYYRFFPAGQRDMQMSVETWWAHMERVGVAGLGAYSGLVM